MPGRARRWWRLALLALAAGVGAVLWLHARRAPDASPMPGTATRPRARLAELRHLAPAALAGTVTADGAAVADAMVCARGTSEGATARCARTGADGAWRLAELAPDRYALWASAAGFGGGAWRGPPPELADALSLGAGEVRADLALVLVRGAVPVRGTIRALGGAPIAGAEVLLVRDPHAPPLFTARSGADGAFEAWAPSGELTIAARADGFVDAEVDAVAPVAGIELALLPGGTLAGTVIDAATGRPIDDAEVDAPGGDRVRTDAAGRFRIGKLPPGRYKPTARAIGGYGEVAHSVRLGRGEQVGDLQIAVHPVAVVAGRVEIADANGRRPCPRDDGRVTLSRHGSSASYAARTLDDGVVLLEGVGPGAYGVEVACRHSLSRIPYPDLVVGDSDVEDLVWTVTPSARVAGVVRARTGAAIAGAVVNAIAGSGVVFASAVTAADGTFETDGLPAGAVTLVVIAEGYLRPATDTPAVAAPSAPPRAEIVLDTGGALAGVVVDDTGAPVSAHVTAQQVVASGDAAEGGARADRGGAFRIEPLPPGRYRVAAETDWDGPTDATARAIEVDVGGSPPPAVRLVVPAPRGQIRGVVTDAAGAPVADAYVEVAREDDPDASAWPARYAWQRPAEWTDAAGAFTVTGLPAARFGVHAVQPGGAETVVSHVAPGERVTLVLRPTGVLAGTVVAASGGPVTDVEITARDRAHDLARTERAYFTAGRFELHDLPAGTYQVTVDGDPGSAITVELHAGEQRTDLRLVLQPRYTLRGRLVGADRAPRVGWRVAVPRLDSVQHGPGSGVITISTEEIAITDADGAFLVHDLPAGPVTISAADAARAADAPVGVVRELVLGGAAPVIDVGDVPVP